MDFPFWEEQLKYADLKISVYTSNLQATFVRFKCNLN